MIDERAIETRYAALRDQLDERGRRLFAAVIDYAAARHRGEAISTATTESTVQRLLH